MFSVFGCLVRGRGGGGGGAPRRGVSLKFKGSMFKVAGKETTVTGRPVNAGGAAFAMPWRLLPVSKRLIFEEYIID